MARYPQSFSEAIKNVSSSRLLSFNTRGTSAPSQEYGAALGLKLPARIDQWIHEGPAHDSHFPRYNFYNS